MWKRERSLCLAAALLCALGASSAMGGTSVRIRDREVRAGLPGAPPSAVPSTAVIERLELVPPICDLTVRAQGGMPAPGQGQLDVLPWFDPATINETGRVAFYSRVSGSSRNQGVFTADAGGLHAIAVGCGGGGGSGDPGTNCGDPAPIGGRFSGFFGGSSFTPDVNNAGDVLFFADVAGGSSSRSLFLRRAATQQIVKVAVLGDPSPLGGVFGAIGPGSLNGAGKVAFLASAGTQPGDANVFLWNNGTITNVAHVGQTIPGSGTIAFLGSEWYGFADGTYIPSGLLPDIDDQGDVAYRAIFASGIRGLLVESAGVSKVLVRTGEPAPIGGTYFDFFEPILNNSGQMTFFADVQLGPGSFDSGWFVGTRGRWRKALAFSDSVDGGQPAILAVSRNPMQPFDDEGNLMLWCDLDPDGGQERLLMARADGSLSILARQGDPTPAGPIALFDAWPSTADCSRLLSTGNAHLTFQALPGAVQHLAAARPSPASAGVEVSWDQGVLCPSESFDVGRGTLGALHASGLPSDAVCAAGSLEEPPYAEPPDGCPTTPGDGCWYLVRTQNLCGPGTWGPVALDAVSPCP